MHPGGMHAGALERTGEAGVSGLFLIYIHATSYVSELMDCLSRVGFGEPLGKCSEYICGRRAEEGGRFLMADSKQLDFAERNSYTRFGQRARKCGNI